MQQPHASQPQQRMFTASEVAEFEYCPLVWWYQQFEPLAQADTEELFASLVELEYEHGSHAPTLPEYQMAEQLLLRKGAFETGHQQHIEHAEEVAEVQEERRITTATRRNMRVLVIIAAVIVLIALLLIGAAFLLLRLM